jgi:single-strand DNA-binding protein
MNSVNLTGRAVREIELRYTPAGKEVATGTIAVQKNFKNVEGKYDSDFIDFVCWGKKATVLADYVKKGDKFGISGRLQSRTYENQEGKKVKVVEVNVEDFDLPTKSSGNNTNHTSQNSSKTVNRTLEDPFTNDGAIGINDEDLNGLPF